MREILLLMTLCISSVCAFAKSYDEKICDAMNSSDWFALDSIYGTAPKDSISPFLEIFSRCLIGNRLNRPDVSIPAFYELLNSQSLDPGNLVSSLYMLGMDLSRQGYNAEAAQVIKSVVGQAGQHLDSTAVDGLTAAAGRYEALAQYEPYKIEMPQSPTADIRFKFVPVGPKDKNSLLMHLLDSSINGCDADITFDTGAGVNLISPEMAERYNLIPLDKAINTVIGVGRRDGYVAIAKEIVLGDITVRDVPFTVVSMSSGNEEADRYLDCFNIVVGSELMLQLKDLTIDFINRRILVPTMAPMRSDTEPNLCFSNSMNLLAKGYVREVPALMCIDSGDAYYGSLGAMFYETDGEYVRQTGRPDSIRSAGIGGVTITQCYHVSDFPVTIGDSTVTPSDLVVMTADNGAYDVRLGLRTLMMYGKMRFNMVDFVLTTEPVENDARMNTSEQQCQSFKYTDDTSPNLLQTIGFVGVAIARGLIYPDVRITPDL